MRVVTFILTLIFSGTLIMGAKITDKDYLEVEKQWASFKLNYGRKFATTQEEQYRKKIFTQNYKIVTKHNRLYDKGEVTYTMKINQFSDVADDELKEYMGLNDNFEDLNLGKEQIEFKVNLSAIPKEMDWRLLGAVTEVKRQGHCGSCWAFATIGALEGQYFLKTGKLVRFSEQNLIDCSNITSNNGCRGGNPFNAYEYIIMNNGINSEAAYPYRGEQGECVYNPANNVTTIKFYGNTIRGSEESLKIAVAKIGPIATLIHADIEHFKSYHSGVYYNANCNIDRHEKKMNHAGLIVGYGTTDEGEDYWIFKNSWGVDWGEDGYGKLARNRDNNCEIATFPSFPIMY